MEEFMCNKMNGGVKVYTIVCTGCIGNIMNIAIIQLDKEQSSQLYCSFRSK
uniref:ORF50c n=1 Tax=Pinus koraiensis TaxID=88728 RepID=A4QMJ9_PINKO|nr:ORF50c [Pinus koraiensis]ABP35311.1 ORF50c [Pinus koraiensis]